MTRLFTVAVVLGLLVTHCKKPAAPVGLTDQQAANLRAACAFDAGALPSQTLASDVPIGNAIPIEHFVFIMQENRSFDSYFSALTNGADVASPTVTNPGPNGPVQRFHNPRLCIQDDVNHSWAGVQTELDHGKMDGFAIANEDPAAGDPTGSRAMGYYTAADLPFYYWLAQTFTISDRHFCSAPGDTAPNREFYAAASSRGAVDESIIALPQVAVDGGPQLDNIYSLINRYNVNWQFYGNGVTPQFGSLIATNYSFFYQTFLPDKGVQSFDQFKSDVLSGNLPSVAFVDEATDDLSSPSKACMSNEHPTEDPQRGQIYIQDVVEALFQSPQWKSTALFITYDEHGGFYDHVYPPAACPPDDFPPVALVNDVETPQPGAFNIYGPRVPLILVSPYAKRGYVSHEVTDHTSLLRMIEARFNLPALTRRDANAEPPYDMFDFNNPDFSIPQISAASAAVVDYDSTTTYCTLPAAPCDAGVTATIDDAGNPSCCSFAL